MRKIIFAGIIGFAIGGVVGYYYSFHKNFKEISDKLDDYENKKPEDDLGDDDSEEEFNIVEEDATPVTPKVINMSEIVQDRQEQLERIKYAASLEYPKEEAPVEKEETEPPIRERRKDVELMTREEWYEEDDDYKFEELYYFRESDELYSEGGQEKLDDLDLCGDIFDRIGFRTNDDDLIYVRNNLLSCCFAIHKVDGSPDDLFL